MALTLVAAVMLLAMTAVRETIVDTAMTQQFVAQINARMATTSALETTLAASETLSSGELNRSLSLGPAGAFETSVSVAYLGTATSAGAEPGSPAHRFFEIRVEAIGPRNATHRRIHFLRTPVPPAR